ncbi:hypothetical protein MHK_007974 [Candidatus Magnetomorum sp. HK-1]|nr:hypothetical protein MHK_007974 [Candidatus Magnetomorum sp. HK-1]
MSGLSYNNLQIFKGLLFICLITPYACRSIHPPVCMKEGRNYGNEPSFFIGKWSDHYIRGLSYMEGECFDAALADLNEAMKLKYQDSRTERYYGMRFMSYFPHREAGIIYYLTGRLAKAKKELRISLSHHATAKASYYLQKTLKQILLNQDTLLTKPTVQIHIPDVSDYQTNQSSLRISGIAKDIQAVSAIHISNESIPVIIPKKSIQFSQKVLLNHGDNFIQIKVSNVLDQECIKNIHIRRDRSGPLIVVKQFQASVGFQCDIVDPAGVDKISANGKTIDFSKGKKVALNLKTNGLECINLMVVDVLGNRTQAQFHTQDFNHNIHLTAMNNKHAVFVSDVKDSIDTTTLKLSIIPNLSACIAYKPTIDIKGKAISNRAICDLLIQIQSEKAKKIQIKPLQDYHSQGRILSFNESIPLALGKNTISITVIDSAGKSIQEQLTITRELSEVFKLKYRLGMEFHPLLSGFVKRQPSLKQLFAFLFSSFKDKDVNPFPEYNWFHSALIENVYNTKRFRVFLSHELKALIPDVDEKKFKCDSRHYNQPDYSVVGDFFTTKQGIEIVLKIIQKETSEILSIVDTFENVLDEKVLITAANHLSVQLHNLFPLIKGKIVNISDNKLKVSFEKDCKIMNGQQLIIFREQMNTHNKMICPFHKNTELLSWAKISQLSDSFCIAVMDDHICYKDEIWAVTQ